MGFVKFREAAWKCARHAEQHDKNARRKAIIQKDIEAQRIKNTALKAILSERNFEIPEAMYVGQGYLDTVKKRLYYNDIYGDYYIRLADEYNLPNLYNTGLNVKQCHKHWFGDWYGLQHIFDRKSLLLCHNRMCANCMHLIQASRLKKFTPIFEELSKIYDLYLATLTIPNCAGVDLCSVLDRFFLASTQVFRYLRGNAKIKGIDFLQYGYVGGIRSLEIGFETPPFYPKF